MLVLKKIISTLILLLLLPTATYAADDNIYIAERDIVCELTARDGRITRGNVTQTYRMGARRVAATGVVAAFYNQNAKVEHASADGGEPQYRACEDEDIFYSGSRVCLLPVEVKPGKLSKAKFEISYARPEYFGDILLPSRFYDTDKLRLTVKIPAEAANRVKVDVLNGTGKERVDKTTDAKGNVTVTVTADSLKTVEYEPMMPEPVSFLPIVRINAAFADLGELYSFLRPLLEDASAIDPSVADLAKSIASEAGESTQDRIDAVAHWVRDNIRYVAIEHGEMAHRPDSAAAVLRKRYGDCKGSANLICALLRSLNIDARHVWIGTHGGVAAPFSKSPDLGAANHMIAAAFTGDSIIYLDGTVTCAPRGYIPSSIAGQECMIENGDSYILTKVGDAYPARSILRQTGRLSADGTRLNGKMRYNLGGTWRAMVESAVASVPATHRPRILETILSNGRKSVSVDSAALISQPTFRADSSVIEARITDSEGVKAVAGGSKLYVMPRLMRMSLPDKVDTRRHFPIDCHSYYPLEADVLIDIPEGYKASGLPRTANVDNPWFEGHVNYETAGDKAVRCSAYLYRRRTEASPLEAKAWNNAVKEVEKASNTALVLTKETEPTTE